MVKEHRVPDIDPRYGFITLPVLLDRRKHDIVGVTTSHGIRGQRARTGSFKSGLGRQAAVAPHDLAHVPPFRALDPSLPNTNPRELLPLLTPYREGPDQTRQTATTAP